MRMHLPTAARVGQPVQLSCQYDLEGAQLYSIKWYRDDSEFYSYVPKEQPATRLYPDQGISVDVSTNGYTPHLRDFQCSGMPSDDLNIPSFHASLSLNVNLTHG